MGANRRYAAEIDARMDERILECIAAQSELQSLTPAELRPEEQPLTVDPRARRKVPAWVRFGEAPARVNAIVALWAADAVGIVFAIDGVEHRCWVWVGAVDEVVVP